MRASFVLIALFSLYPFKLEAQKKAATNSTKVHLTWTYSKFEQKIDVYDVTNEKRAFVSETGIVANKKQAPIGSLFPNGIIEVTRPSRTVVLVVNNTSNKDLYFFAVPHTLNPSHASAGHYFECLCIGRLYHVPPNKVWYRIVRLNLNDTFQDVSKFEINHKIEGVAKTDALTTYKERIYAGE